MQEKERYISPECEAVALQAEGLICNSEKKNGEGVNWGGGY